MEYREPSDIEIYKWEKGIVLRNNSLVAIDANGEGKILARGRDAQYVQKEDAKVYSPIKEGKIAEWKDSCKIIRWYVYQIWGKKPFFRKPKIAVCTMPGLTQIEQKAFEEAVYMTGAKKVVLVETSIEEYVRKSNKKECDLVISIGRNFTDV